MAFTPPPVPNQEVSQSWGEGPSKEIEGLGNEVHWSSQQDSREARKHWPPARATERNA